MNRETYNDVIVPMMQHIQELEERICELELQIIYIKNNWKLPGYFS